MKKNVVLRGGALALALISVAVLFFAGCTKQPRSLILKEDDTVYKIRTPLREAGAQMNTRISDLPGEDPFVVTDGAAPDPFIMYDHETDYYYGLSTQNSVIRLHRAKLLADLFTGGESVVVYRTGEEIGESMWAPEMYFIDGKWYIYSSGTVPGEGGEKHLFVLESGSADPFDGFHFKAYLDNGIFGIDPTLYYNEATGRRFICFSEVYEGAQWLSIAELTCPWKMGRQTRISGPFDYQWERLDGSSINEGPFFVASGTRLFIIFSANGCYSDSYRLGLLEYTGGDPLSAESWSKYTKDIFSLNRRGGVFAPGHASFFYSPDHTELWIAYHCYYSTNRGATRRMRICQVQRVDFDADGFPVPGEPLPEGTMISVPSGE